MLRNNEDWSTQHKAPAMAENFSTTGEVRLMYG